MSQEPAEQLPKVTLVMPVRNESVRIRRCLASVLAQDYPHHLLEILVVVGASDDGTETAVGETADGDGRVRIIDNPDGRTPVALNLGLRAAQGDVVGRVDGHAWIAPDFVSEAVAALLRSGADGVGGVATHVGEGAMGKAIATAMTSRLGAGNASFRVGGSEGDADTVVFGLYRRAIHDRVGEFDESLTRNQDDEFNHRVRSSGGRLYFAPTIRSSYVVRGDLRGLARQYWQYGQYRVHTLAKHRRPGALRQLAPPALVAVLAVAAASQLTRTRRIGRTVLAGYAVTLAAGALTQARDGRAGRRAPLIAAALGTLHLSYGLGFWAELARRALRRG